MRHRLPDLHPAEAPVSSASLRRPLVVPRSQIDVAGVSTTCRVTAAAALRCLGW